MSEYKRTDSTRSRKAKSTTVARRQARTLKVAGR